MYYGVKLPDFEKLWQEAMKQADGQYNDRTLSDEAEQAFWRGFMAKKEAAAQDQYAIKIAAVLEELLKEAQPQSILEIGPGWGNYTIALASLTRQMDCVDISQDVLDYITKKAVQNGIFHIKTHHSKWESFHPTQKYDVIFGFNCFYRMGEIGRCLEKINSMAEKMCIIGMTSGPEQPYHKRFEMELGVKLRYSQLDYIYLINLLYGMGIDVNCRIIPLKKVYQYDSMEEVIKNETGRILSNHYDVKQVQKILEQYYIPIKGKYSYIHHFKGAMLYWTPDHLI